ncbi:MAG TPA: prepilin-type N-terminal cleavage/methylation domain-containing protein [Tepidisphaeraceae bacterium]|jgi:prepilin-type N-terminal cleavage/methylation domain-containing protein|nr:prepilin-type N-terminal cleavage/methylation domain-containing protein [Tepidisphaeraceae bacterium]
MRPRPSRAAFTLVELLVVILIIGILVGILIPVVTKIKAKGYAATTLAQINALRGAIEAYQGTYNAYPGPIPDHYMYQLPPGQPPLPAGISPAQGSSQMTMAENLVLGLMGGLNNVNGTITFNPNDVGSGPRSLSPGNPGQQSAFYTSSKELTQGFFSDKVDNAGKPIPSCFDSSVPEFVDRFTEPMPILYLRARRGAKGVMSDMKNYNAMNPSDLYQYDVRQYYSYICDPSGGNPSSGIVIGGRKQENRGIGFWEIASANPRSGIGDPAMGGSGDPLINSKDAVNYAIAYFRDPSLNTPANAVTNETGTPRSKDSFILISAGPDRLFGTADDLTTFGSVVP